MCQDNSFVSKEDVVVMHHACHTYTSINSTLQEYSESFNLTGGMWFYATQQVDGKRNTPDA